MRSNYNRFFAEDTKVLNRICSEPFDYVISLAKKYPKIDSFAQVMQKFVTWYEENKSELNQINEKRANITLDQLYQELSNLSIVTRQSLFITAVIRRFSKVSLLLKFASLFGDDKLIIQRVVGQRQIQSKAKYLNFVFQLGIPCNLDNLSLRDNCAYVQECRENITLDLINQFRCTMEQIQKDRSEKLFLVLDDVDYLKDLLNKHQDEVDMRNAVSRLSLQRRDNSLINQAAKFGAVKSFRHLLINGHKIDSKTLESACVSGNSEIIQTLTEKGVSYSQRCISKAIKYHHQSLLQHLIDDEQISIDQELISRIAVQNNNISAILYFIMKGYSFSSSIRFCSPIVAQLLNEYFGYNNFDLDFNYITKLDDDSFMPIALGRIGNLLNLIMKNDAVKMFAAFSKGDYSRYYRMAAEEGAFKIMEYMISHDEKFVEHCSETSSSQSKKNTDTESSERTTTGFRLSAFGGSGTSEDTFTFKLPEGDHLDISSIQERLQVYFFNTRQCALQLAIKNENWRIMKLLIDAGIPLQSTDYILASQCESDKPLEILLQNEHSIEIAPKNLLEYACKHSDLINKMINLGFSTDGAFISSVKALNIKSAKITMQNDSMDQIDSLTMKAICQPNCRTFQRIRQLSNGEHFIERVPSRSMNSIEMVEFLVNNGYNINKQDENGNTLLHHCFIGENCQFNLIQSILNYNADPNIMNKKMESPFSLAIKSNSDNVDSGCISLLINNGADVNLQANFDTIGITYPINYALKNCNFSVIELLINNKASVNEFDSLKRNCFSFIIQTQPQNTNNSLELRFEVQNSREDSDLEIKKKIVGQLIKAGVNNSMKGLLTACAECGFIDKVKELLSQGIDPNEIDQFGFTPLMKSVLFKSVDITKILLEANANPNCLSTSLSTSRNRGHFVDELISDDSGQLFTPIIAAIKVSNQVALELLLKHGADPNIADLSSKYPLEYSAELDQYMDILFESGAKLQENQAHTIWSKLLSSKRRYSSNLSNEISMLLENGADPTDGYLLYSSVAGSSHRGFAISNIECDNNLSSKFFKFHVDLERIDTLKHDDILLLHKEGYDINQLMMRSQSIDSVKLLLNEGGDINANDGKRSALISFIKNDVPIEPLLEMGANPNLCYPLHVCASIIDESNNGQMLVMRGHNRAILQSQMQTLINAGVDINSLDQNGCSPLYLAYENNGFISFLMELGAKWSCEKEITQIKNRNNFRMLIKAGAKINKKALINNLEDNFIIIHESRLSDEPLLQKEDFKYPDFRITSSGYIGELDGFVSPIELLLASLQYLSGININNNNSTFNRVCSLFEQNINNNLGETYDRIIATDFKLDKVKSYVAQLINYAIQNKKDPSDVLNLLVRSGSAPAGIEQYIKPCISKITPKMAVEAISSDSIQTLINAGYKLSFEMYMEKMGINEYSFLSKHFDPRKVLPNGISAVEFFIQNSLSEVLSRINKDIKEEAIENQRGKRIFGRFMILNSKTIEVLQTLFQSSFDKPDENGITPIELAIKYKSTELFKCIIQNNVSVLYEKCCCKGTKSALEYVCEMKWGDPIIMIGRLGCIHNVSSFKELFERHGTPILNQVNLDDQIKQLLISKKK